MNDRVPPVLDAPPTTLRYRCQRNSGGNAGHEGSYLSETPFYGRPGSLQRVKHEQQTTTTNSNTILQTKIWLTGKH